MLKEERFEYILGKLQKQQKVLSVDLSRELKVSEDTIRRDLKELADNGQVTKVHGGALLRAPVHLTYQEREHVLEAGKLEIARKAVALLRDGQLIILDGGTTTWQIARLLPPTLKATIFTHSLPIAMLLTEHPSVEVILAGGKVFKQSRVTLGIETLETFRNLRADLCLLGICSLHHEVGLSYPDREEAQIKRAIIHASAQVVALATSGKLGSAESFIVGSPKDIDTLITDHTTPPEVLQLYREAGIEVL